MTPPLQFQAARGLKILFGALLLIFLGFDLLTVIVAVTEREAALLVLGVGVLLPLTGVAAFLFARSMQRILLHADRLEVRGLLRRQTVLYAEIAAVTLPEQLCITTHAGRTLRLGFNDRDQAVPLLEALHSRVPGLRSASILPDTLPLVFWRRSSARWTDLFLAAGLGLVMCLVGGGGLVLGVQALLAGQWGDALKDVLVGGLMGLVGLLLAWIGLFESTWSYRFFVDRIEARALLRWRRFPVADLQGMVLRAETRTMKGVERTAWVLALSFVGGRELTIEPTEGGFPGSFSPEADRRALYALSTALRSAYAGRGL